jgi:futalosine hydrolase
MLLVVAATERELECAGGAETLCCGVGPVEAALHTARALAERRPAAVVHVGIAGARTIEPKTLVLGSEAVYVDVIGTVATARRIPIVERAEPDPGLLAAARLALPEASVLPIATCGRVGGGEGFDVEAMEGFGVLRAAQVARVPAVELRAISNAPDEDDRGRWLIADALAALEEAVPRLLAALARELGYY